MSESNQLRSRNDALAEYRRLSWFRLCGEMVIDYSMASQTTVLDQRTLKSCPICFGLSDST